MKVVMVRKKRNYKNMILKTITSIAIIGEVLAVCSLDSDSNLPLLIAGICSLYLVVFFIANREE
jgi:uncharacterized membrane protein